MTARLLQFVAAVPEVIGLDELLLGIALALIDVGLWTLWRPGVYLVTGLVLLWMALPPRRPFIDHLPPPADKKTRRLQ